MIYLFNVDIEKVETVYKIIIVALFAISLYAILSA